MTGQQALELTGTISLEPARGGEQQLDQPAELRDRRLGDVMMVLEHRCDELCSRIAEAVRRVAEEGTSCQVKLVPDQHGARFLASVNLSGGGQMPVRVENEALIADVIGTTVRDWLRERATNRGIWTPVVKVTARGNGGSDESSGSVVVDTAARPASSSMTMWVAVTLLAAAGIALWFALA